MLDFTRPRLPGLLIVLTLLAGCASGPSQKLHHRVLEGEASLSTQPQRLLLLPLSVEVKEMSASGLHEAVPTWTDEAKRHINHALVDGPLRGKLEIIDLPELSDDEKRMLDEHIALFDIVGGAAVGHTMIGPQTAAWKHKSDHFDYTIGPGLAFLRDKTGADKALFLFGEDVISSSGRKAVFIVAAAFSARIPMGHSFLIGGLVDLESGDVLWLNYTASASSRSFRNRADVDTALTELFKEHPALKPQTAAVENAQ
ncbi:hypothetical protein [Thiosocius teredinicola]|uniref:hypothetical protein n=1 Tax=Thiosocius teredinicola TaxID=1973002 RepID=UPI0009914211